MRIIYYVEINLICIILLLLIKYSFHRKSEAFSAEMIVFNKLIWSAIFLCLSDMVAGIFRGLFFYGARIIIEVSNLAFYELLSVIGYLWMIYVNIRLKIIAYFDTKRIIIWGIPLILFTLVAITNPWTHILFIIDANNLYSRNSGVVFHWIITWLYLLIPTVQTFYLAWHEKNKYKRQAMVPLLFFVIPPFFGSVAQMLFYGVTSSQVGITIAIVFIFLFIQRSQIMTDPLTGLNNRHGLNRYLQNMFCNNLKNEIVLFVLDMNNFKQINDRFGHIAGDNALKSAADALIESCKNLTCSVFLCRFGGDEFVIILRNCGKSEEDKLKTRIQAEFEKSNRFNNSSYVLEISMGTARGACSEIKEFENLLQSADKSMYKNKRQKTPIKV